MKLSIQSTDLNKLIDNPPQSFSGAADGYDALILADYCRALSAAGKPGLLHITRDAGKREELPWPDVGPPRTRAAAVPCRENWGADSVLVLGGLG